MGFLKDIRTENGKTLESMADLLGLKTPSAVFKIESGGRGRSNKRSLNHLVEYAKLAGITVDELLAILKEEERQDATQS